MSWGQTGWPDPASPHKHIICIPCHWRPQTKAVKTTSDEGLPCQWRAPVPEIWAGKPWRARPRWLVQSGGPHPRCNQGPRPPAGRTWELPGGPGRETRKLGPEPGVSLLFGKHVGRFAPHKAGVPENTDRPEPADEQRTATQTQGR